MKKLFLNVLFLALAVALLLLPLSCSDGCKAGEVECDGSAVMVCNGADNWETLEDCSGYWPDPLECIETDTDANCEEVSP